MTPEQRIARAERMLTMFVRAGRRYRTVFRAQHREMNGKINILINTQIETSELLKGTDQQIQSLTASQVKTDDALRRLIDSLSKGRNGNP